MRWQEARPTVMRTAGCLLALKPLAAFAYVGGADVNDAPLDSIELCSYFLLLLPFFRWRFLFANFLFHSSRCW